MASFTDTVPQFNSYVQQLPVEAMVNVGVQKQKQYDEGIQKIQTNIDNIAGLDMIRDVDRAYLQSKVNELGNNLKTVSAGDFSHFQLVNSVNGMTNQIVKDPNVLGGVTSTARVRKEQARLEDARKTGKSSVQNEAYFNNELNGWLNNPDLKTRYTGQYVDYVDVDSKLRSVADKVHELDNSIDIPYKRDGAGNVIAGKDGKPIIDDAMLRIKTKGKPAEKILSNFYSSLTPDDERQLHIDAWYHYRGATPDTFKADAFNNYQSQRKVLSDGLVSMSAELVTNPNLSSADKSAMQARINDNFTKLHDGSLEKALQETTSQIDGQQNIEEYKYKLYTQKHLTSLANDLSYQSIQQSYETNPYFQADMSKKELQFKYDNARREQSNWERKFAWDQTTWTAEQILKKKTEGGSEPIVTPGRLSTDVPPPTLSDVSGDIDKLNSVMDNLNSSYAPHVTNSKLTVMKDGKIDEKKTAQNKKTYLDYLARNYAQDPGFLSKIKDNNLIDYLEKRRSLEIQIGQKNNLYNSTAEASKKFDVKMDQVLKGVGGVVDSKGKQIYSAKELYEFGAIADSFKETATSTGMVAKTLDTKGLLAKYKGTRYEPLAIATVKSYLGTGTMSSTEKTLADRIWTVRANYMPELNKLNDQKMKFQSDYLAQRMPERQTAIGALSKENKVDMNHVDQLLNRKAEEFAQGGVDNDALKDYNPDTVEGLRNNPKKNVAYKIEKKYDGSANLIVSAGTERQVIPMTDSEFTAFFPEYSRKNPINEIKYAVLSSPNKTTNLQGGSDPSNAVNAYLSGYDLPNLGKILAPLVRLDVEGSPFNDGSGNDKYQVRMYVNENGIWKTDIITKYVTDAGLTTVLNGIGPSTVTEFLNKTK